MRVMWVTALVVLIDQASKLLVKGFSIPSLKFYHPGMQLGESIPVIGDFFRITFVENPGMAFGIDTDSKMFLTLFTLAATVGITWYLYRVRNEPFLVRLSLALILGGAIGNLIDRSLYGLLFGEGALFHGRVVDFFDVDFFDISIGDYQITRWFVFNIADAAVSVGVVIMLLSHSLVGRHAPASSSVESPQVGDTSPLP